MADTSKTTNQLKIIAGFTDGDERTISIENPRSNISATDINALNAYGGILIGDKYGAPFHSFKDAELVESTVVSLDLADQS